MQHAYHRGLPVARRSSLGWLTGLRSRQARLGSPSLTGQFNDSQTHPGPRDPIKPGKLVIDIMSGQVPDAVDDWMDARAAAMGWKGGAARAASMTQERRAEIARKGAAKRLNRGAWSS